MGLFNKQPFINVNMNGKEYIEYLNSRKLNGIKIKLSKNQKEAMIIFCVCFGLIILLAFLLNDLFYVPKPTQSIVNSWIKITPTLAKASWDSIGKFLIILFSPLIVLAWLIHGVGFFIFKG